MATATAYWRPSSLAEAFELLARPGAVALAGGTHLNDRSTAPPRERAGEPAAQVVDLQGLGLAGLDPEPGDGLRIGATATLQQLADSRSVPEAVRDAARRELPSTLRAQATVGGCVATGEAESELLAALLVHEAVAEVRTAADSESVPLETLLARLPLGPGRLVTAVTIRTDGRAVAFRTARTPADRAIVSAHARVGAHGRRLALTGVAPVPVLVEPGDHLDPTGDFRGSADYRSALAGVLLARAVEAIA